MKDMAYIVYISLALLIFILLYFLLRFILRRSIAVRSRLDEIKSTAQENTTDPDISILTGSRPQSEKVFTVPLFGPYLKKTAVQLVQAHILIKPSEYLLLSLLSAAILFLLVYILTGNTIIGILPGIIGFFLPKLYISSSRNKRARKLSQQLPEFLNILSNALRAGLSFNQAIATAGDEMVDPIKWEFKKVLRDNNLGRPMEEALLELVKRTGDEDIEMFVTAINIQRQVGGNLSEVLDIIAATIRERVKLKGEVRTLTAQSRVSAIIIGLLPIFVALIISMLNPNYLKPLFTETLGQILLATAAVMVIVAALLLKKISTLEV